MKKILLLFFTLIFVFIFTACGRNTSIYKTLNHGQTHSDKDEDSDTTPNLNYKVETESTSATTKSNLTNKTTTTKPVEVQEYKTNAEYPYVDVETDGDSNTYEWPDEGIASEFPALKSGKMGKPYLSKTTFSVYFANVDPDEFDKYLKTLESLNFTVKYNYPSEFAFMATNEKVEIEFFFDTTLLGKNTLSLIARYI